MSSNECVAVVGLGYVGLPLALAFAKVMPTIGFDISEEKVNGYRNGIDPTGEMERERFKQAEHITFTADPSLLKDAQFHVVAVPTPIDPSNRPDLRALEGASRIVGKNMSTGAIVIFESTVYPGVTEDVCVPILEAESGMVHGRDFKVGYSPERINPGDKVHTLETIIKVVSGEDADTLEKVAGLYERIVTAGVHRAASIKVAEAAKVIENTQRDLNIALMNELAIIFDSLGIDTLDVLEAADTKWNFLPFRPGLVGGHCIGVDPYYLTHMAQTLGYNPEVILAGRRINDSMGKYVVMQTIKRIIADGRHVKGGNVLVMGLTFKENVADLRNSRAVDVIEELREFGMNPLVWDPVADPQEAIHEYGVQLVSLETLPRLEAVMALVPHNEVLKVDLEHLAALAGQGAPFADVKSMFDRERLAALGFNCWRL